MVEGSDGDRGRRARRAFAGSKDLTRRVQWENASDANSGKVRTHVSNNVLGGHVVRKWAIDSDSANKRQNGQLHRGIEDGMEVRDESLGEVAVTVKYSPNVGNMQDMSPTRSISHKRLGTLLMWKGNINRGVNETWVLGKVGELPDHLVTA
jgi:hypothetical protein